MWKKGIGIVGLAFAAFAAAAAGTSTPKGFTDDLDAAMKSAKENGRNIMAVFSGSDWCIWCKRLENEILSADEFLEIATNAYELVYVDNPKDEKLLSEKGRRNNRRLTGKYGVQGFPSVLVLDADGKVVAQFGYENVGPREYLEMIDEEIRLAPDIEKFIKPIELLLRQSVEPLQAEAEEAMKEAESKFPEPTGTSSPKERRRRLRKIEAQAFSIICGRIADKHIPLQKKAIEGARAMEVPAHLEKRKAELIEKAEYALSQFMAVRDAYRANKDTSEADGEEPGDGEGEGEDDEGSPFRSGLGLWLKDWSENARTNMAVETCASFRETKLRPFLIAQMDPEGKATPDERKVLDASIDYIWGAYGFKSFGDRKRLVEILDRTAKPSFAAFVKACVEKAPASDQLVAWLEDGRFAGEDMRCVYWTLRKNFGFGSKETLARLEKAGVDEWLLLLWRMKIERNAAWAARGGGYANTVTEEGWSGFEDHGDACRAAFRRAWELHQYPEAAYFLSELGPFQDEVFLDVTAAQLDFDEFLGDFLWYNCYPRWCGSHEKMKAFAERCYETGRHDTMVPIVYAEAMLRMIDDAGENQEAYLRGHPEELDRILEVSLPQISNTNAFGQIRQEAGAFATLAYSVKGDWEKAGETFRSFGHGTFPSRMWRIIQDFNRWWTIWDGISGSNRKELQRLHAMFAAGDFAEFLKGAGELRARAKLDGKEDSYMRWMEISARMKTDFPAGKPITVAFPKGNATWLAYGGAWKMNGEYAYCGGKRRGGDNLEWDLPVPGNFRLEIEVGPHGDRDEWSFDFCQKPADQALAKPGDYPFLMLRFAKGGATASFGEWNEVKDGGDGEPIAFPYAGGNVRLAIVYRDGRASVFVDGAADPLIETDDYARILRRVGEGTFKFNGSGARILAMKVMSLGGQSGAEIQDRGGL